MEKRRFCFLLRYPSPLRVPFFPRWTYNGHGGDFDEPQFKHHHVRHRSGGTVGQPAGMRLLHPPAGPGQHRPGLLLFRGRLRLHPLQRRHDHEHSAPDQRPVHLPNQLLIQTARPRAGPTYRSPVGVRGTSPARPSISLWNRSFSQSPQEIALCPSPFVLLHPDKHGKMNLYWKRPALLALLFQGQAA